MVIFCVVAASLIFQSSEASFTISINGSSSSKLWMGADGSPPAPKNPVKRRSAAEEIAFKIGLNVVPKGGRNVANNKKKNTRETTKGIKHPAIAIPTITWGKNVECFFWGDHKNSSSSPYNHRSAAANVQRISNKEGFPLVLLRGALPPQSLARALSLMTNNNNDGGGRAMVHDAEELEQHELVDGSVRALRRSLVSRLDTSGELYDIVTSNLPPDLVGMGKGNGRHVYEDGSVVCYRRTEGDFYDEHHDSYTPGEIPRERQRAYTILIYIRTPPGPPSIGGTEFTRLTLDDNNEEATSADYDCVERGGNNDGMGVIVKPNAGDALVWPNFDQEGKPYEISVHRALSLTPTLDAGEGNIAATDDYSNEDDIGKIVLNLWFEGYQQLKKTDGRLKKMPKNNSGKGKKQKRSNRSS